MCGAAELVSDVSYLAAYPPTNHKERENCGGEKVSNKLLPRSVRSRMSIILNVELVRLYSSRTLP